MLNTLLIAEACNPTWASVPLVGYNLARALTKRPELNVTLATHVRNRDAILADPIAGDCDVVFIDNEWIAKPLYNLGTLARGGKSLGWTTQMAMNYPSYVAFEHQLARRLDLDTFDLIHRVTPLSPTMPSPVAAKTSTPMLLGPLNGGLPWPKEWPELRGSEREWLVPLRRAYRHAPYWKQTYRHLAGVIAGSRHTATEIPESFAGHQFFQPENGIDPARFPIASDWTGHNHTGPFRFLSVGRLVPYKATDVTIEAFARLDSDAVLTIVGDGPKRKEWLALAQRLGVSDRIEWVGWVEQTELADHFARSDAFVFPSLREFGGGVFLEAMASGLPSILVDYGGPAELVDESCAVAVPMCPRTELIDHVEHAMRRVLDNRDETAAMGRAAAARVRDHFTWDAKADEVLGFYEQLLGQDVRKASMERQPHDDIASPATA